MAIVVTRRRASGFAVGLWLVAAAAMTPMPALAQARELPAVAPRLEVLSSLAADAYRRSPATARILRSMAQPVEPRARRPHALVPLYATFGALQVLDGHSTVRALDAGAVERNPVVAPFGRNPGAMVALKAAATTGTIVMAEKLWKRHPAAAVALLAAVNVAYAAIVASNYRR